MESIVNRVLLSLIYFEGRLPYRYSIAIQELTEFKQRKMEIHYETLFRFRAHQF